MARIRHPNIAQVLDVDECAEGPFFVMEYYCNNLGALLGEGYRVEEPTRRLGVEAALGMARQLASALARLHHEGVLHRDVKPFNLMLAEQPGLLGADSQLDQVKLIDFGLSRLRGELGAEAAGGRPKGAVVGSPYYSAPEQEADPEHADERADVFSVGVTLFRCLTGLLPQEGQAASRLRQGLDERFDDFFTRCCHEKRSKRPGSARELLAELDALSNHWAWLRKAVCALPEEPTSVEPETMHDTLRAQPVRQGLTGARERFGLDELWRPRLVDRERFAVPKGHPGCVRDRRTGLLWERGGTTYPVNLAGAVAHAEALDEEHFAGQSGWRLPTAEELATLLMPEPDLRQLCLAPSFDPAQRRLWSLDRKSFMAAWYADVEHGFLWWQDVTCEFHARCVCGPL
jgi:serine/threonine-protein kinase